MGVKGVVGFGGESFYLLSVSTSVKLQESNFQKVTDPSRIGGNFMAINFITYMKKKNSCKNTTYPNRNRKLALYFLEKIMCIKMFNLIK